MLIKRLLEQYYRNYPNADNLDSLISYVGERVYWNYVSKNEQRNKTNGLRRRLKNGQI